MGYAHVCLTPLCVVCRHAIGIWRTRLVPLLLPPCPPPLPPCPQVSPLVSYAGEGLEALVQGRVIEGAYDLDLQVRGGAGA